jgi:hypothetical protein
VNPRTLFQHAYLVDDVRLACKQWHRLFGAGPFAIAEHHKTDRFDYRGTDIEADVSYGFGYLGELMIQFIQQHDNQDSIYRDMYPSGEAGFHHVAYLVNDFAAEKARLEAQGFVCACQLYADGVDAAYFDTRAVTGGFTEIHGDPPHIVDTFDHWRRAHQKMQAGDEIFLT